MRLENNRRISLGENGRLTLSWSKGAYHLSKLACRISHFANGTRELCRAERVAYKQSGHPSTGSVSLARNISEFYAFYLRTDSAGHSTLTFGTGKCPKIRPTFRSQMSETRFTPVWVPVIIFVYQVATSHFFSILWQRESFHF